MWLRLCLTTMLAAGCRTESDPSTRVSRPTAPFDPSGPSDPPQSTPHALDQPPPGFPEIQITGTWRHPLWLSHFERFGNSFATILNEDAQVVWARAPREPDGRILRMRGVDDGVLWAEGHRHREEEFGYIGRQSWREAEPEWTRAPYVHHDLVERDGGYLYLSHEFTIPEFDGDDVGRPVAQDVIAWVPRGATTPDQAEIRFRVADHLSWSVPCSHVAFDVWIPEAWDWTHANSLVEDGDDLWVMVRYHDAAWRIGPDYALLERVGGVDGEATATPDATFTHSHISHFRDGRMVLFDNRNHDGPSRAMALSRGALGWQLDWEIPGEGVTIALGDVQELDDGSVVVAWGTEGRIDAYDADLNWEGSLTLPGVTIGRVEVRPVPEWAR